MRWLMIVLLVSLAVLLLASLGLAHHIWRERVRRDGQSAAENPGELESEETS
jgi:hypothetical protein